jgi:hypothetical protein
MRFLTWSLLSVALLACHNPSLRFHILFVSAHGLQTGDRVFLAGQPAGQVEAIEPTAQGIKVTVKVHRLVTRGSSYTLASDPQRPERQSIQITPDPDCQPLEEGALVLGTSDATSLFSPLLEGFTEGLKSLEQELGKLELELKQHALPEFLELAKRIQELALKMQSAEKSLQQDLLPKLQQELEHLREELRKSQQTSPNETTEL